MIEGSTALGTAAKPYVIQAQIRAVSEHLERRGESRKTIELASEISAVRVRFAIPTPAPLVSLIVPAPSESEYLVPCVDSILQETAYRNFELIVMGSQSIKSSDLRYLQELPKRDPRVRVLHGDGDFNFPKLANKAAKQARGSILGFLADNIQVICPSWLEEMVTRVSRPDIGAVGARLIYPNGTLHHVGMILGLGGVANPQFSSHPMHTLGYFCRAVLPQNLSVVSAACMLVHRGVFEQVGAFDQEHLSEAWYDVDLCLKLRRAGHLVVYTPYAELLRNEQTVVKKSQFKNKFAYKHADRIMRERWGAILMNDPYYNLNLTLEKGAFELGSPPDKFGSVRMKVQ
jgi:GT2 family glycosyltransferase